MPHDCGSVCSDERDDPQVICCLGCNKRHDGAEDAPTINIVPLSNTAMWMGQTRIPSGNHATFAHTCMSNNHKVLQTIAQPL